MAKKNKLTNTLTLSNGREKSKTIPSVSALNNSQKEALRIISNDLNHITLLSGIAGSGKTHISASWGLQQVLQGKFNKLIITRPYVEAGESLGFLPGDFDHKIAPFMIPIFDVLNEHLSNADVKDLIENQKIVILPLAYMRGVTFKNSFVLLDEGQNSSVKQMHLFLTRIGQSSKIVITGDPTQSDLGKINGFTDALDRLTGIEGIAIHKLEGVVRHPIIESIDKAYNKRD